MKKLRVYLLFGVLLLVVVTAITQAQVSGEIAMGDSVSGELSRETPLAEYTFTGQAGDSVVITLESGDFDSFLVLLDPDGDELATDDDGAGDLNARIGPQTLPEDGTYTIIAQSARQRRNPRLFSAGAYTLTLESADSAPATATPSDSSASSTTSSLQAGVPIVAMLTDENPSAEYTLEGHRGDIITLTLESEDFDVFLVLINPDGEEIATDDDSLGRLNAQIGPLALHEDGTYTVVVESARHYSNPVLTSSGTYELTLKEDTDTVGSPDLVQMGEPINGELDREHPTSSYTMTLIAGDVVTFSLESDDFDGYLILQDADGEEIVHDDDSGPGSNPMIGPFAVPESGAYTVVVTSFSQENASSPELGEFTLTVDASDTSRISYGETITGQVTEDEGVISYVFDGQRGDVVVFDVRTDDIFGTLELLVPGTRDNVLAYGSPYYDFDDYYDDYFGGIRMGPVRLPQTGRYTIRISDFGAMGEGDFVLTVSEARLVELEYDKAAKANIGGTNDLPIYFSFEGEAGQAVDIYVDSKDSVDSMMTVFDPYSSEIASDDDSGSSFDPQIDSLLLTETGTYTILVEPFDYGDRGEISIIVIPVTLPSLDNSSQRMHLTEDHNREAVTFTGVADQEVELTIRVIGLNPTGEFDVDVIQGNETLASISVTDVKSASLSFIPTEDGPVNVSIEDWSYDSTTLEITLTRVGDA